jgi:hypothetical protein
MRLRHQYMMAGMAWALLLGPGTALLTVGMAAGVSWLWLFGDDSWPKATEWILPLIGIAGGSAVAVTCVVLARSYGIKREALPQTDRRAERRRIVLLSGTPLALILLFGVQICWEGEEYTEAVAVAAQREAAFQAFVAARHKITGLIVDQSADGAFRTVVRLDGEREGAYRLAWRVADTGYRSTLVEGERAVRLYKGAREIEVPYHLEDLARRYKSKHLTGGGVLIEEPFRVDVTIEPILTAAERTALPPGEVRRLKLGESPLRSQNSESFPVRFIIRLDGTLEK